MKYIVGAVGLRRMPFLLPVVAIAALVLTVSAVLKDNTGGAEDA